MPSDYESITKSNIKDLGERTSSRKSQVNLYSQPTHFIYELLQNADDYGATTVEFRLNPDELILEHNGTPFQEENVRAISDFENSTSKDDETKTGRFGLGFKSVFAFTATPQIISGDESFEIYGLYRLRGIDQPDDFPNEKTRIVLPFNHSTENPDFVEQEKKAEDAYEEISAKLQDIGLTTLLFTKNVQEVRWSFGSATGHYLKEIYDNGQVYLTDGESEQTYLVFQKSIEWEEEKLNPISIAFLMENGRIVEAPNRSLFVLFETALETHLGFLVNGAFRTTPSRENIRYEDALNKHLILQLAELLGESMGQIKTMGLLDVSFVQSLPIKVTDVSSWGKADWQPDYPRQWPFMPLYQRVRECFLNGEYLPKDQDGKHANAGNALLARGEELRALFPENISKYIWGKPRMWLDGGITTDKTPALRDYLIHELAVKEVSPPDVLGRLGTLGTLAIPLFENSSLAWLIQFFLFANAKKSHKIEVLSKNVHCIPLQSGEWVGAKNGNVVFHEKATVSTDIPMLLFLLKEEAGEKWEDVKEFLEFLGVHQFNSRDEIWILLNTVYCSEKKVTISVQAHLNHMRTFVAYWEDNRYDAHALFSGVPIFLVDEYPGVEDGVLLKTEQVDFFLRGSQCYIDQPIKTTFLSDVLSCNDENTRSLLSHCYVGLGQEFIDFAESLGVQGKIEPIKCNGWESEGIKREFNRERSTLCHSNYKLPEYLEDLLKKAVAPDSLEYERKFNASVLIWELMCKAGEPHLTAQYQANRNRNTQFQSSKLIQQLAEFPWLLHKDGGWKRPCDLTNETLYTGVTDDDPTPTFDISEATNGWLKLVGFGQSEERQAAARVLGIEQDDVLVLEQLKKDPKQYEKLRSQCSENESVEIATINVEEGMGDSFNKPGKTELNEHYESEDDSFSETSKNPVQREKKLDAGVKERKRSEPPSSVRKQVRVSETLECKDSQTRETILQWYKGKCQICGETWPKRNGKPYFVAAYLIEHKKGRWIDEPGNAICLCAKHFAQWRHASKQQCYEIPEWIMAQKTSKEGGMFPLRLEFELLGKKESIKYREDHFLALRSMVKSDHDQR
ncbi:sacsin N-terminal ATP-binding-like domain-containing protein [Pontiella agarivorans]|uniref:Sacsin/Nov domain-containing protein n=1 Tax=Pontiella agarivorans TaxID=3038953 RepID=A0ABU5MVR8_9BACT|nr:hypothetical protein [Pontiella agarivorans]MDZ8118314.1 hypothetical protein [Pontiella agarivorans]